MPEELVLEMDELIGLDSKRIKSLDAVSVNSTENTRLFFARPSVNDTDCASFLSRQTGYQPTFTYPFFGQEELWKGCSKASLTICFDPQTFFAHVSFTVDEDGEEFRSSILEKLTEKLAKDGWTEDWSKFVEICSTDSSRPLDYGKSDLDKSESNGYSIISVLKLMWFPHLIWPFRLIFPILNLKKCMNAFRSFSCFSLRQLPILMTKIRNGNAT